MELALIPTHFLVNNLQISILSKYTYFYLQDFRFMLNEHATMELLHFLYSFRNCYTPSRVIEGYRITIRFRLVHREEHVKIAILINL